jgi:predicted ATP-grasp superfamily ATP-dependent carboligase
LFVTLVASGICEPEFKYDERDQKFKLMKVNLCSMMWYRTGKISGVSLHKSMYECAIGQKPKRNHQFKKPVTHFVYMLHKIGNLIARKSYWKHFKHNIWKGYKRILAVLELWDMKSFFYSIIY